MSLVTTSTCQPLLGQPLGHAHAHLIADRIENHGLAGAVGQRPVHHLARREHRRSFVERQPRKVAGLAADRDDHRVGRFALDLLGRDLDARSGW